ncbi:TetR/AcrR family transcriptional regulator [Pedobacter frigoris]|uniref:TetR/AcrR family transcriptional regulator n=1 Tax=Pedobacter frigoris TaxID=2571272 RepID=A0A4U1CBC6_9SPHI|nr:TetR/AcrR family transcriptional regulator [Pedobacter frigoris]TKC03897.1 TetR/AcrR family transcriptional regulator [Pedobacter frigoris]
MNTKPRKIVSGEIRDKEKTMLKLINAVGEIIKTEGYTALGVNKIAKKAEVNKKLIYRYFDNNVNNLIETYVKAKDYWIGLSENMEDILMQADVDHGKELLKSILNRQLTFFYTAEEMQKIIIWEISEKNKMIKDVSFKREEFGEEIFKLIGPYFENADTDIRSLLALQVAGVYYMVLQAKANGNTFCGVDINEPNGMERVLKALDKITDLVYKDAEDNLKNKANAALDKAAY